MLVLASFPMKFLAWLRLCLLLAASALACPAAEPAPVNVSSEATATVEPPTSWIDADTGHRVIRLTREPNSASLYFNENDLHHP